MHPFLKIEDVLCALHTPEDGHTDPTSTTNAMAIAARKAGAEINRHNRVLEINKLTKWRMGNHYRKRKNFKRARCKRSWLIWN